MNFRSGWAMSRKMLFLFVAVAALCLAAFAYFTMHHHGGKTFVYGTLEIIDPTIRETVPGAKVAAGYLTIRNTGPNPDRLMAVGSDVSAKAEVHKMEIDPVTSVMKMGEMEKPPQIKSGETIKFLPGGNHIMLMQLSQPLKAGETHMLTLTFENAGVISVPFDVKSIGDTMHMHH